MRRKKLWLAVSLLLVLVLALPMLLNLDVFLGQVHRALERQLGREVEVASLTAQLLPRPGVVGRGVVVYEQEEFGAEPLLYAEEVQCRLSLRTLRTLRLEFSEIHFVRPSINLVRNERRAWNVASFLLDTQKPSVSPTAPAGLPLLSASDARINFKLGANKLAYALAASNLQVKPLADGRWRLALRATPLRTDRRLSEVGELTLEGEVGRAADFSSLPFRLRLSLPRGSSAQLWALFADQEPLFRAAASLTASLEGTPAEWRAQGSLTLADVRRWDLVAPPRAPLWTSDFRFVSRSRDSTVVIEDLTLRGPRSEVKATGSVVEPFGRRLWNLDVRSERLVFDELLAQLAGFQEGVADDARLEGAAGFHFLLRGPAQEWQGELTAPEGLRLQLPGFSAPVELADLQLRLARGRLELQPLSMHFSPTHALQLRGEMDVLAPPYPYRLLWESEAVPLDPLRRVAGAFGWNLFGPTRWRGLAQFKLEWRGQISGGEEPRWQGQATLQEASFQPPELNQPLEITEAHLAWQGQRFEARPVAFRLGEKVLSTSLSRVSRSGRWNLTLEGKQMRLSDLDELLNPARMGLLTRLVRPASNQMSRWRQLDAAGSIKIGQLTAGPFRLEQVEARGEWQAGWLELTQLRFRLYAGRFDGRLQADFRAKAPRYHLAGNLKQLQLPGLLADTTRLGDLFTGLVSADLTLETAGDRPRDLLRQLHGRVLGVLQNGAVNHLNLVDAMSAAAGANPAEEASSQPTPLQSLGGEFLLADEQVMFDGVRLITNRAALELSGSVDFEGQMDLRLTGEPLRASGRTPSTLAAQALAFSYRLTGSLRQPQVIRGEPLPETPTPGR